MKKILAFVCILALALTLISSFAFAAAPELDVAVTQEGTRTGGVHYVVKTATHMYVSASPNSGYVFPSLIPVGAHLTRQDGGTHGAGGVYYKMMYNSYVGYVLKDCLTEVQ